MVLKGRKGKTTRSKEVACFWAKKRVEGRRYAATEGGSKDVSDPIIRGQAVDVTENGREKQ